MRFRCLVFLILSTQLFSCAETPVKENYVFKLEGRDYLYQKKEWSLNGRIAISDQEQSLSASIDWKHHKNRDEIELSGAFGQGRTRIELLPDEMMVDDGEQQKYYYGKQDELVSDLLGIQVPLSSLKFWVRGLLAPKKDYRIIEKGFLQSDWTIRYIQMQVIGQDKLPRKIRIENAKAKASLKLVINQW